MAALPVTLATQDRYPSTTEKIGRKARFSVYSLSLLHPGLSLYTCMHLLRFPFVVLPLTKWNLAVLGLKLN